MLGLGRKRHERAGYALYTAAVAAARNPWYFSDLAVPDTLDGRFDLVSVHVAVLIRCLRHHPVPGPALAQAVFDAMFSDMDVNLREIGVGDMVVGKRVRQMWEAFHGRALAYEAALEAKDRAALAQAIARNVWRGAPPNDQAPQTLATCIEAINTQLARQTLADLTKGAVTFPNPLEIRHDP